MKRYYRESKGMSLYVVFGIIAVMIVICTAMTGIGLMNLNITQSFYNGSIAQNEAEAAVAVLLYNVSSDINYGLKNEKITGTITDGYNSSECYHVITFDRNEGFPWSVNAKDNPKTGFKGRTVPRSMVSAFATGCCRGQYRTIEVLLYRPPYPYAIASSGRIHSQEHILVDGVDSTQDAQQNKHTKPGHIYSSFQTSVTAPPDPDNPDDYAVYIGDNGGDKTYISGFILSPGQVLLKPPATVKEGIRARGDKVEIPCRDVSTYDNEGDEGVIKIVSEAFASSQNLDAMYFHSGSLTFTGNVAMNNAFLYLENGTLKIEGGLTGCGAIVVKNGSVHIKGNASLDGNNRIAILCGGPVTIEGNNNYFQGLVYSQGNISAKDITVVGNLIMDGRDFSGQADTSKSIALSNFKILSNSDETATIAFTAHSSKDAETAYYNEDTSNNLPCIGGINESTGIPTVGIDPTKPDPGNSAGWTGGYFSEGESGVAKIEELFTGNIENINFNGNYGTCDQNLLNMLSNLSELSEDYQTAKAEFDVTPPNITEHHETPPPGHDEEVPNPRYIELQALMATLKAGYEKAAHDFAKACYEVYKKNTNNGCTYNTGGKTIDVSKPFNFDVNEFISTGARLKVMHWHLYNARL